MAIQGSVRLAVVAAAAISLSPVAEGHVQQQFPISRQYAWSRDFYDSQFENVENKPYAYNAGGVKEVMARGIAETDPTELEENGAGEKFPLYFQPRADNGNYLESNEIAKRHGVCGDPRLGGTAITYSTPNSEWEVLDTFVSGQEIEIDVVVVYYHWGHLEFFICDTADLDDPDDVVTQECFNKYPLTRAPDENAASPIDPDYTGRYYMDPPCRKDEVEQNVGVWVPEDPYNVRMRYLLPDIECEHCVLQMHYMSGDRCRHIGVDEFNPDSWNSACAPNKEDWIDLDTGSICGQGSSYPEEFWACSDFAITSNGESDSAPSPVSSSSSSSTSSSEPSSTSSSEPSSTSSSEPSSSTTPEPTESYTAPSPEPSTTSTSGDYTETISEPEDALTCSNGVTGIEGSNDDGTVCCPVECGQCGTSECHQAGLAVDLDNTHCCVTGVLVTKGLCSESETAPCIIETGLDDTYYSTYSADTELDAQVPTIEGATYLGCFEDVRGERTMNIAYINNEDMTNEECVEHCKMEGHVYAGTENDYSCWCGDDAETIDRHGTSTGCGKVCTGDITQVCGGLLAVTTWATGIEATS
ncbi:unnamed protein product [Scytosiphon promiscuus]